MVASHNALKVKQAREAHKTATKKIKSDIANYNKVLKAAKADEVKLHKAFQKAQNALEMKRQELKHVEGKLQRSARALSRSE